MTQTKSVVISPVISPDLESGKLSVGFICDADAQRCLYDQGRFQSPAPGTPLPSGYQLVPPFRLAALGPGVRLRHSLYEASHQYTILSCVSNVHADQIL